jgi:hypothetical protein
LASLTGALIVLSGCEKEPVAGPSQPAPRTPNKATPGDGEMTPEQAAATPSLLPRPQTAVTPAPAPGSNGEVRMVPGSTTTATPPAEQPAAGAAPPEPESTSTVASFAGLTGPKPATWQYRAPAATSTMRVAEYSVPGVEGADQAQIVVYQFPGGGSLDANVERWKSQFRNADGSEVVVTTESLEADGMKVTVAELAGEYRGMGKSEFAPDQVLIASMIEGDGDPVFVQLVGPSKTVRASREAFMAMMRGLKQTEPMK